MTVPLAGQPGHGCTASLRRQPSDIVEGRLDGGYAGVFELICCECGDHPYLDYSEISPPLQRLRGPYTMRAGLAAYEKHLGLTTLPARDMPAQAPPELATPGTAGWEPTGQSLLCARRGSPGNHAFILGRR